MQGKTCLVTGGSSGLGKATAAGLAALGARVVLLGRDPVRGEAARAEIAATTRNPAVELLIADLADQQSVRDAAQRFLAEHNRLDVLINNAAVFRFDRVVTGEGFELTMATNYLGPFLLTNLLLDLLKRTAPSRIVNVACTTSTRANFNDLTGTRRKRYSAARAYGASKMCDLLFTYELAIQLADTGVTVNAMNPGLLKSNLMNESHGFWRGVLNRLAKPPEQGAETAIYLASSPELNGVTGTFYKEKQVIQPWEYALNRNAQTTLWSESLYLTGLSDHEPG